MLDDCMNNQHRKSHPRANYSRRIPLQRMPTILGGWSATRKLIPQISHRKTDIPKNDSGGVYCVRFVHSSDIFPDVDDLRRAAWLQHLHSCSEICPCHIDPRCRIGTSSSTS